MTVIPFTPNASQGCSWSPHKLAALVSIYETYATRGEASAWDVGTTELGEPQFYILGPAPDLDWPSRSRASDGSTCARTEPGRCSTRAFRSTRSGPGRRRRPGGARWPRSA